MKQRLAGIRDRLLAGEEIDHEHLETLCAEARANPDRIPVEDAAAVIGLMDEIATLMVSRREAIHVKLTDLRQGRTALRGYSALRSTHLAQRLLTKG